VSRASCPDHVYLIVHLASYAAGMRSLWVYGWPVGSIVISTYLRISCTATSCCCFCRCYYCWCNLQWHHAASYAPCPDPAKRGHPRGAAASQQPGPECWPDISIWH
jgi:hypothetical protein